MSRFYAPVIEQQGTRYTAKLHFFNYKLAPKKKRNTSLSFKAVSWYNTTAKSFPTSSLHTSSSHKPNLHLSLFFLHCWHSKDQILETSFWQYRVTYSRETSTLKVNFYMIAGLKLWFVVLSRLFQLHLWTNQSLWSLIWMKTYRGCLEVYEFYFAESTLDGSTLRREGTMSTLMASLTSPLVNTLLLFLFVLSNFFWPSRSLIPSSYHYWISILVACKLGTYLSTEFTSCNSPCRQELMNTVRKLDQIYLKMVVFWESAIDIICLGNLRIWSLLLSWNSCQWHIFIFIEQGG